MIGRRFFPAAVAALLAVPSIGMAQSSLSVADYVAANGAAAVFAEVRKLSIEHSGWLFVSRQWTTPAEILPCCARLGWVSVRQIAELADLIGKADYRTIAVSTGRNAMPSFTVDGAPVITVGDMHTGCIVPQAKALRNCGITADHQAVPTDGFKYLLTTAQWDEALSLFTGGVPEREFKYGKTECEEFAFDFMAHLGRIGLGSSAAGLVWLQMYANGAKLPSGHVTVLCVDTARRVWLLDPIYRQRHALGFTAFRGYRGIYSDGGIEALADGSLIQTIVI